METSGWLHATDSPLLVYIILMKTVNGMELKTEPQLKLLWPSIEMVSPLPAPNYSPSFYLYSGLLSICAPLHIICIFILHVICYTYIYF